MIERHSPRRWLGMGGGRRPGQFWMPLWRNTHPEAISQILKEDSGSHNFF